MLEREKIEETMLTGKFKEPPSLARPETQLMWAAALLAVQRNVERYREQWSPHGHSWFSNITATDMWKTLTTNERANEELLQHGFYVNESLRRPDTRFKWGAPGTWFYFHPEQNFINVDFLLTLAGGFEHTRAILFHEIGHSQLTTKFTKRSQEIREEMEALKAKQKQSKKPMPPEDYKKLRLLAAEWSLRHKLFDAAENNTVNRYTANQGQIMAQDYAYSLNHVTMTVSGFGKGALAHIMSGDPEEARKILNERTLAEIKKNADDVAGRAAKGAPPQPPQQQKKAQDSAQARFLNVLTAINLTFFKNNDLFKDERTGWERFGVNPDWIRITAKDQSSVPDDVKNAAKAAQPKDFAHPHFQYLVDLCGGNGLENLQPVPRDRWYGADYFNKLTDEKAEKRCEIVEHIWDMYLARYAEIMLHQVEKQVEEELKQKQKNKDKNKDKDGENRKAKTVRTAKVRMARTVRTVRAKKDKKARRVKKASRAASRARAESRAKAKTANPARANRRRISTPRKKEPARATTRSTSTRTAMARARA
jgi:hypothetical protein